MAQSASVAKLNQNWHQTLVELNVTQPQLNLRDKARILEVSMAWISVVENSDAFKEAMRARRDEHFNRASATMVEKVSALADMVVEELTDRIERNGPNIPIDKLKDVGKMALDSLGFGTKNAIGAANTNSGTIQQQTNIFVDRNDLAAARTAMAAARAANSPEVKAITNESANKSIAQQIDLQVAEIEIELEGGTESEKEDENARKE